MPIQRDFVPDTSVVNWLLEGDIAIQHQARRDLLGKGDPTFQARIASEGWGARFLAARNRDGSWGERFYQPKWISSHYTLLDLRTLELPRTNAIAQQSVMKILAEEKRGDGGIGPARSVAKSDVCVNGMFLDYACWFDAPETELHSIVDFLIFQHMPDGGFNCQSNFSGARHSSMHSTISVLEGFLEFERQGYRYRLDELLAKAEEAREFLLTHRLYKSDHTGEIVRKDFLQLSFPPRWKYNILRALDHFRLAGAPWDDRMSDAMDVLLEKRRPDGKWPVQAAHAGQVHFTMENAGGPSRWNTLMALRVLKAYSNC